MQCCWRCCAKPGPEHRLHLARMWEKSPCSGGRGSDVRYNRIYNRHRSRRDDGQCRTGHAGRPARDRGRRRTRRIYRPAARRPWRRGGQDRTAGRQCHPAHRTVPEDEPGLERSLFFWNYNRNKKSVVLDLRETLAREHMLRLLEGADILLDSSCGALNTALGWTGGAERALPQAGHRAHDAVRRRWAVGGFQGLRSDPSRAGRRDDELRLRSRSRTCNTTRRRSRRRSGTPITSPASNLPPASSPR